MKTLEQIKQELIKLKKGCKSEEQFIEAVAVMYLSCALDREFLASHSNQKEKQPVGV